MLAKRLIKSNDAGGGCTNTVDLYNPFPDGGGVALYQLNGDATDVSGNYDGSATNVTWGGAGQFGTAANFSVSGSRIVLPTPSIIPVNLNFSLSIWIKGSQIASSVSNTVYLNFDGSYFGFTVESNNAIAAFSNSSNVAYSIRTTSAPLDANSWNHIVISSAGLSGNCSIYVNGNFEVSGILQSTTRTINIANGNVFGDIPGIVSYPFNGEIDQVRFFNRALRPYEVEALYTEEYCTPTIVPSEHFNTVTYTGNGTTNPRTDVGFQPDLVWIKCRNQPKNNRLYDSVRGATNFLESNNTDEEEVAATSLTSFDSSGFTLGSATTTNSNNDDFVAWCWKAGGDAVTNTDGSITSQVSANTEAGFSVVSYTGDYTSGSSQREVGHGLNLPPEIVIIKNRTSPVDWYFYTDIIDGSQDVLYLNKTDAKADSGRPLPNSSIFYIGGTSSLNILNNEYICYAFHSVEGFSNFGSYVGTGTTSGNVVVTGFEPAFVMVKRTDASGNSWLMVDNKRVAAGNEKHELFANTSTAESGTGYDVAFLENGFQMQTTTSNANASGASYIYMAFAADPTAVEPTLEDSFNTVLYTGNSSTNQITGVGFEPNMVWIKNRDAADNHRIHDSIRSAGYFLEPNTTNAEQYSSNQITSFDANGFTLGSANTVNTNGEDYVAWNWKGAEIPAINSNGSITSVVSANPAAGFSIVSFTSNGAAGTIGHGLDVAPDVVIWKNRSAAETWWFQHTILDGSDDYLKLNETVFNQNVSAGWVNSLTSTTIKDFTTATNGQNVIAYCFAEVAGFSKFGSYSGAVTPNFQDCGFEPAFVIIKSSTNSAAGWLVFDNVRGTDKRLYPYANFAEYDDNGSPIINFTSTGFSFNDNNAWTNGTIHNYIYMAFANQF